MWHFFQTKKISWNIKIKLSNIHIKSIISNDSLSFEVYGKNDNIHVIIVFSSKKKFKLLVGCCQSIILVAKSYNINENKTCNYYSEYKKKHVVCLSLVSRMCYLNKLRH